MAPLAAQIRAARLRLDADVAPSAPVAPSQGGSREEEERFFSMDSAATLIKAAVRAPISFLQGAFDRLGIRI